MNKVPESIKDIAPPVDFFPYPLWMIVTAGVVLGVLLCLAGWMIYRWIKKRPGPAAPTPREAALARLENARAELDRVDPYAFSILISDVLREYVFSQFRLPATRQTSPEFLAGVAQAHVFSEEEKGLLAEFLEAVDMIKFAHAEAGRRESGTLLEQAIRFVKGEAHEAGTEASHPMARSGV